MRARAAWCLALLVGLGPLGCPDRSSDRPDAGAPAGGEYAEIRVTDDAPSLLFTYLMADGSFQTVDRLADVPEAARAQVIVVDTSLSPELRRSGQVLYVADLTRKRPDGAYPYSLVSRFKFERELLRAPGEHSSVLPAECQGLAESPRDRVVLYSTAWCGVCKTAAAFMKKEGIPFEEKDVEADPAAQRELGCKALRAGKQLAGVPVLDVGGALMVGFDRDTLVQLARNLVKPGDTQ
jgi:glutaredoxin